MKKIRMNLLSRKTNEIPSIVTELSREFNQCCVLSCIFDLITDEQN